MKIGNHHSKLLDNFTENYAKIAKMILQHDFEPEKEPAVDYDDFLDKFVKNQSKDVIRSQIFRFLTTEANRDNYLCELILKKTADHYKLKLTHYSGSFDYAAFQSIWKFAESEKKLANNVFDSLTYALDGIRSRHNADIKHPTTLVPIIREAIKPIAESHQYRKQILSLDENDLQQGENDWQQTIYGSKYPEYQDESKQAMFSGDHQEEPVKRTMYTGRNSKTIEEI